MDKATTSRIDTISRTCIAVRLRLLNRVVTNFYDDALRPLGLKVSQLNILIVTAEASYHAPYDHCTSQFLRQAGVEHDFIRLADTGIRGNGHMMMLEKNNLEIAAFLRQWLEKRVK